MAVQSEYSCEYSKPALCLLLDVKCWRFIFQFLQTNSVFLTNNVAFVELRVITWLRLYWKQMIMYCFWSLKCQDRTWLHYHLKGNWAVTGTHRGKHHLLISAWACGQAVKMNWTSSLAYFFFFFFPSNVFWTRRHGCWASRRLYMSLYFDRKGQSHLACWPALRMIVFVWVMFLLSRA